MVAVDMTGFGKSPPMTYAYSLDDYAREIKGVIDELGEDKIDVVAHSFGARVLVRLLADEKRIDKIILTGAAGLKPRRTLKYHIKRDLFKILSVFVPKSRLKCFYSSDYNCLSSVMKESFKLIIRETLDEEYKKITNRTLIVFGKDDRETPLYAAERMRKCVKDSRLVVIARAGHFCFSERPAEFNSAVFSFLMEK